MNGLKRILVMGLLLGGSAAATAPCAWAQQTNRVAKSKVEPIYPELARRIRLSGIVKVQLTVAPNGTVKDAKLVGGHPVLADAVLQAVKKWRYEAGPQETIETVQFRFDPNQ